MIPHWILILAGNFTYHGPQSSPASPNCSNPITANITLSCQLAGLNPLLNAFPIILLILLMLYAVKMLTDAFEVDHHPRRISTPRVRFGLLRRLFYRRVEPEEEEGERQE